MENDVIYRQAAIDAADSETVSTNPDHFKSREKFIKFMDDDDIASFGKWQWANGFNTALVAVTIRLEKLPSAQPEQTRIFVELVVEYPDPELCTYKEYRGKPYYSIKYIENGERYVGFGTYKPEVLSQYLKEYFISFAQPESHDKRTETHACDLISRQEAIDAIRKWKRYETTEGLVDRINKLSSAQPEQQWIPVSERLPEENMWTICQNNAGAMMIGKYDIEKDNDAES